jgi:cytoskeleton protein RodZ
VSDLPESHDGSFESAGAALVDERRRQSLSVGDVSRHLKLSVRQVEALENDEFKVFGGPVFVHGFLRNYAKLLGLDPGKLIEAADRSLMPQEDSEADVNGAAMPNDSPRKSAVPLFLIAAILIVGVFGWMLSREDPSQVASPPGEDSSNAERQTADSQDETAALTEPGAEVLAPMPDDSVPVRPVRRAPDVAPGVVRLVFDEESWIEIIDRNGEVILSILGEQGTTHAVSGQPPLSVIVGNSAGVKLTYNDRPVDLALHTQVHVARLTLE